MKYQITIFVSVLVRSAFIGTTNVCTFLFFDGNFELTTPGLEVFKYDFYNINTLFNTGYALVRLHFSNNFLRGEEL